jgi:hypothetical protein
MKTYKIVGIAFAALAVLFASAIPSYAERFPRARKVACGVRSAMARVAAAPARVRAKFSTAFVSCSGSLSAPSCSGAAVASCSGVKASCSAPATVVTEAAPTPIYLAVPTSEPVFLSAPNCADGKCFLTPVRSTVQAVASGVFSKTSDASFSQTRSAKGSLQFAQQLAREGRMYHDSSYIGYENVASGASSPEDAVRMWQNSPPHRRNLPFITDIQCVNGFCVGR